MSKLFETTHISSMALQNRFVRSATWDGMANEDGSCSQRQIDMLVKLAKGKVGLIISGSTFVSQEGQSFPFQPGVHSDDLLPGLASVTKAVHGAGGKIVMQLFHGGLFSHPQLTGQDPMGPSVMSAEGGPTGKEMTVDQIRGTVEAVTRGAVRAKKAGFDGVQVHAAHGFLLSQYLSPAFNHREDAYGGSLENRARFLLETVQSVRGAVGDDYPVLAKLNAEDFLAGGFGVDEMLQVAAMLERSGVDAIELSGGTVLALLTGNPNASFSRIERKGVYYESAARRYKGEIGVPLILLGGIRSYEASLRLVEEGITDYVAMARPLIREPGLVARWASGDTSASECISDNACLQQGLEGKGVHCIHVNGE